MLFILSLLPLFLQSHSSLIDGDSLFSLEDLIFSLIYLVVTFISLHRCCSTRGGHLGAGRETTTGETATRQAPAEGPLLPQAPPDAHAAREGVRTADARQHAPRRRDATSSRAREATSAQAAEV